MDETTIALSTMAESFATAAHTSAFSTRYGAICPDVWARVARLAAVLGGSFDARPAKGRSWIALFDNNPKGNVAENRAKLSAALQELGWVRLGGGGSGRIEDTTGPYTDCGIWDVPAELAADGAHEAESIFRAAAVKLGLAANGINF
jgi:hypothetical protein